jgi:predicted secreted protein
MDTAALQALRFRADSQTNAALDVAPLSDTGTAVPVAVTLTAPAGLTIRSFELIAPENPVPRLIQVTVGAQTAYQFDTRIRLGASQDIWLIATLSDGSLLGASAHTVLTSSACFDAS